MSVSLKHCCKALLCRRASQTLQSMQVQPGALCRSCELQSNAPPGLGSIAVGSFGTCTNSASEIFFNDAPMTLARYPNLLPNGSWAWLSVDSVSAPQPCSCPRPAHQMLRIFSANTPQVDTHRSEATLYSMCWTRNVVSKIGTRHRRGCTGTGHLTGTCPLRIV